jgi:hypothetical protein
MVSFRSAATWQGKEHQFDGMLYIVAPAKFISSQRPALI